MSVVEFRRYEGASNAPRTAGWVAPSTDATAAIGHGGILRNRARDAVRNNPHAAKIIALLTDTTVGYGIKASIRSSNKRRAQVVKALFDRWSNTPSQIDAAGRMDLYGIQRQVMRSMFESGECLIRLRPRPGQAVPIALQVLETDFLYDDGRVESLPGGGFLQYGIEFDEYGKRVAYRIRALHPGSATAGHNDKWFSVPANEILHIFRADRPGQHRGVSILAPVIIRLRELDIFQDAFLKRQQICNLFTAFIAGAEDPVGLKDGMEFELPELGPGTTWALPPGVQVVFSDPPDAAGYQEFVGPCLRDIATGVPGITYEGLTGDFSQSNFSASRMAAVSAAKAIEDYQYHLAIPQICDPVFQWFKDALYMRDIDAVDAYAEWTPPAITTIADPVKEYEALATGVAGGFVEWGEAVRSLGYDPASQLDKIEQFQRDVKARGVVLDFGIKQPTQGSDGRQNTASNV
jgi:lambda family phage portal protein